jgi:hypothetical protein
MGRRTAFLLFAVVLLGLASPGPAGAASLVPLEEQVAHTVILREVTGEALRGKIALRVESKVNAKKIGVTYIPNGETSSAKAIEVEFEDEFDQALTNDQAKSIPLVFNLPPKSSPLDLNGIVALQPKQGGKPKGKPFEFTATGAGSALQGVSVQPEKLSIELADLSGPFDSGDDTSAGIQLQGPGVPTLFQHGTKPPRFDLLLRSNHGDEVHATLNGLAQSASDPNLASGTVKIHGTLGVGKYEGVTPISTLSIEAPKLTISIEAGDSFVWAVAFVFLGTLSGGLFYLMSNRKRRKSLLRDEVKSLLATYVKRRDALAEGRPDGKPPLWTLDRYLGDEGHWYEVKWNAIPEFDGAVRTIWSNIHWARSDGDLDGVATQVAELKARIVRWLTVANSVVALELATKLQPDSLVGEEWKDLLTPKASDFLLAFTREFEPPDDKATKSLIDRIDRQAHWHTAFARTWHARAVLKRDVNNDRDKTVYDQVHRDAVNGLKLEDLDRGASPESGRDPTKQTELEQDLGRYLTKIKEIYKGSESLELPAASPEAIGALPEQALPVNATGAVYGEVDRAMVEPILIDPRPAPTGVAKARAVVRGNSGSDHKGKRIKPAIGAILWRDSAWTVVVALVSSAAYIPTIYNPTWGTPADYVSAFCAGFIGKAAVNWAAAPLFQSLQATKAPAAEASSPDGGPAPTPAGGAATGAAAPAAGAAAAPAAAPAAAAGAAGDRAAA